MRIRKMRQSSDWLSPFPITGRFHRFLGMSWMTQYFYVSVLAERVAGFAGASAEDGFPGVIAQTDVERGVGPLSASTEFIPRIWGKLRDSLDIEWLSNLALTHGPNLLAAIIVFYVGRMVARMASAMMVRAARKARVDETLLGFIGNVAYVLMLCVVGIAALSRLGIDTTSLTAVLAAAGFAVGMALQGTLGNFASGILLVFFKPFRVGDFVDVGGVAGHVVEIQIFNTILRTPDNVRIIVPNSTLTSGTIRNLTAEPQRRIDLVVGTSYHDDLRVVRRFLEELVRSDDRILPEPAPVIAVSELGDSSVNFVVRPWVMSSNYHAVKFSLIEKIKLGFDERGLTIPFPSRDVFVHHSMGQNSLPFINESSVAA